MPRVHLYVPFMLAVLFQVAIVSSLIAYDCGHEKMNKTRISALNIEECEIRVPNISHEEEDIQLLELNEVANIHIYQCKINVIQSIYYCGMFSHLSLVPGGLSTFIVDISKDECLQIQNNGTYRLQNNRVLRNIGANSSTHGTEMVAGSVDSNGYCKGTSYSYGANSWTDVVVMHAYEFTIMDYVGSVRLEDNQVILRNNILCPYLQRQCMDVEFGMSFWDLIPDASCESLNYHVLYQGDATKAQNMDINSEKTHIIYTVSSGDVVFALEIVKPISVCRYNGFQTEHPRLVIVRKSINGYWFNKKADNSKNLDLLTYINTKFVYVERHIKSQIQTLYVNLIHKKCELERDVLKMQLAVAHHHPSEFAFMRMKQLGYTALSRGEVIYIVKCQAVEVTIRKTTRCFNELPVYYNNQSYFMAPTTHLLQEFGSEIPCSSTLIPAYFIHGSWYGFSPQSHRLESPGNLKASDDIPWTYEESHDLIKAGIYSMETSDTLRRQIMYPTERRAIENVVTRTLTGHDTDHQNINMLHLFSKDHLGYLKNTWWFLNGFGNICSVFMGLWLIIRILKYIISLIINIKMIRTVHGKSWWLLAAICNSFTAYVLHKGTQRKESHQEQDKSGGENKFAEGESKELPLSISDLPSATRSRGSEISLDTLRQQSKIYPTLTV